MLRKALLAPSLVALLLSAGLVASCKHEHDLKECVDEHTKENLSEVDAITECLSDELAKKFTTQTECESFVEQNGGFAASRTAACKKYFEEVSQPAGDAGGGAGG
jgi:hypothetical protein